MNGLLHVYGQRAWHDEVLIKGTPDALRALRQAIDDALHVGTALSQPLFVNDGEGFVVHIECNTEDEMDEARKPYSADYAGGR